MQTGRRQKTTCHFQAAKPLQPADSAFFARFDKDASVERLILPIIRSKQDEQFVPVANPSPAENSLLISPNYLPSKDLRRESHSASRFFEILANLCRNDLSLLLAGVRDQCRRILLTFLQMRSTMFEAAKAEKTMKRQTVKASEKQSKVEKPAKTEKVDKVKNVARKEAVMHLREILMRRRDALRRALAGDLSSLKELREQSSGDVMDAAMDSAQNELSSQLAEVESRELAHIEVALERMRDGEYGACEGCNEGIPLARLQALPYATMCIQCQREAEKNGDSSGGNPNWARIMDLGMAESDVTAGDLEIDVS